MKTLKTPDVTKAQMIALATMVIGLMGSMGIPLSSANEARLTTAFVAIPTVLMIADMGIRIGRAVWLGKHIEKADE